MELFVADCARAIGVTAIGKREDQVDIRGKIQLAATKLAHADDAHACGFTSRRARRAVARRHLRLDVHERAFNTGFGQLARAAQCLQRAVGVINIVDQNAQTHCPAITAQGFGKRLGRLMRMGVRQRGRLNVNHGDHEYGGVAQCSFNQPVTCEQGAVDAFMRPRRRWPNQITFGKSLHQHLVTMRKELAQFGSKLESIHARIFSRHKDKARRDLWSRRAALPFGPWTGAGRG